MDLNTITIQNFKDRFYRDFTFSNVATTAIPTLTNPDIVQDRDITNAFGEAQLVLNQCLFGDDAGITAAYLLLTAHFVALDIQASQGGQGGVNSPGAQPVNARSVGNVSESYTIPQSYIDNPIFAGYISTSFGLRYLQLALPRLIGNVVTVDGWTRP